MELSKSHSFPPRWKRSSYSYYSVAFLFAEGWYSSSSTTVGLLKQIFKTGGIGELTWNWNSLLSPRSRPTFLYSPPPLDPWCDPPHGTAAPCLGLTPLCSVSASLPRSPEPTTPDSFEGISRGQSTGRERNTTTSTHWKAPRMSHPMPPTTHSNPVNNFTNSAFPLLSKRSLKRTLRLVALFLFSSIQSVKNNCYFSLNHRQSCIFSCLPLCIHILN